MNEVDHSSFKILRSDDSERIAVAGNGLVYGYAAGYSGPLNPLNCDSPGAGGRALPNSFKNLNPANITLTWMMQASEPIGKILSIYEDVGKGLYYKAKLILEAQRAREAYALLKFGAPMHSAVAYMESRSVADPELTAYEGSRVFSSLWVMTISLCSTPLCSADSITAVHYE